MQNFMYLINSNVRLFTVQQFIANKNHLDNAFEPVDP